MDTGSQFPLWYSGKDFTLKIEDLSPDQPLAVHQWPGGTLTLHDMVGDVTLVRTLARVRSIESLTIQPNPDHTEYTFLAHPGLRTEKRYTPANVLDDIRVFVNLLKERIQWRNTTEGAAFVKNTRLGTFVTLRGFSNIEEARKALEIGTRRTSQSLLCLSEEEFSFEVSSSYGEAIHAYFN
jgi:hypothetical protein